jgi:para-aminobenzoate synthetase component 1
MRRRLFRTSVRAVVDPEQAFRALYEPDTDLFWLDSGATGWSYLGSGARVDLPSGSVLPALRRELASGGIGTRAPADEDDPDGPAFRLGLVGWLGYETRQETTGIAAPHRPPHPDAAALRVTRLLAVHGATGAAELLSSDDDPRWRADVLARLAAAPPPRPEVRPDADVVWRDDEARYLTHVAACQAAIAAGEAYQLCLTTQARVTGPVDPLASYLALRASSPSHHGGFLRIGGTTLLSASPERFLEVETSGIVRTRPIKGTRPRAADPEADTALAAELRASDKEQAENLMIVDLMRNDLSRVCEVGSVAVTRLLEVESYPAVHQLVSEVEGRLSPGLTAVDAIAACFPAGSMTGAPKLRATELLAELEGAARGLYSGVFGYLGFDGRADLAMVIRSIVVDAEGASVGAGGGVTALSDPAAEYAEMRLKAAAPLAALGVPTVGP